MDFAREARPVPLSLVSGRAHYERVIDAVEKARTSVWIATANLKDLMVEDHRVRPGRRRGRASYRSILEVLDELCASGVELRILHASDPSRAFRASFDKHPRLVKGGLELRQCPRVHLKTVIVDARLIYLGSANFTGAGLGAKGSKNRNFELGLLSEDEELIDEVQSLYHQIWSGSLCKECGRRKTCGAPLDL